MITKVRNVFSIHGNFLLRQAKGEYCVIVEKLHK